MKVRVYPKDQTSLFPLYAYTSSINTPQPKITRDQGYKAHQIFIVSDGYGVFEIEGKVFEIEKNDMFFIEKGVPHTYHSLDEDFSFTYLSFFGDGFENIKKYYGLECYGVYKNKNRGSFEKKIKEIFDAFDSSEVSTLCALTFSGVIAFFDEVCKKEFSPIEEVLKYIEENYSKALTLNELLTVYPYSKAKLCRKFKEKYNSTVFEVITDIRLNHAKNMLKATPEAKLETVASSCGFNDISYFCKMYKRKYNSSPKS